MAGGGKQYLEHWVICENTELSQKSLCVFLTVSDACLDT